MLRFDSWSESTCIEIALSVSVPCSQVQVANCRHKSLLVVSACITVRRSREARFVCVNSRQPYYCGFPEGTTRSNVSGREASAEEEGDSVFFHRLVQWLPSTASLPTFPCRGCGQEMKWTLPRQHACDCNRPACRKTMQPPSHELGPGSQTHGPALVNLSARAARDQAVNGHIDAELNSGLGESLGKDRLCVGGRRD